MRLLDRPYNKKNFILLLLPILGFLIIKKNSTVSSISTNNETEKLNKYTKLSSVYGELVHELQKERGMAAVFFGSKGNQFSSILATQREQAWNKVEKKSNYWQKNIFDNKQIQQLNNDINHRITILTQIRNRVSNFSIPVSDALAFYTNTNELLLSFSTIITTLQLDAHSAHSVIEKCQKMAGNAVEKLKTVVKIEFTSMGSTTLSFNNSNSNSKRMNNITRAFLTV